MISIEKELERQNFFQTVLCYHPKSQHTHSLIHMYIHTHRRTWKEKKKRTDLTMGGCLVLVVREPSDWTVASRLNGVGIGWRWFLTLLSELTQTAPKRWQLTRHLARLFVTTWQHCCFLLKNVQLRIKERRERKKIVVRGIVYNV